MQYFPEFRTMALSSGQCNDHPHTLYVTSSPLCGSYRLFVTITGCFTLCTSLASQTSMNSALVCMMKPRNDHNNISYLNNHTRTLDNNVTDSNPWKFDWDSKTKGWAIASFFISYWIMQIPAGVLVNKYGAKVTIVTGLLATAMFHVITVPAARWNMPLLYVIRFLAGLSCGCLYPSVFNLVATWSPYHEKTRLFSIAGVGLIQIALAVIIIFGVTNFPSSNRYISEKEAKYIADSGIIDEDNAQNSPIPVGAILRSVPVWGFVFSQIGSEWMCYTLYTQAPLFLREFLNLSAWTTSIICSIPLLVTVPIVYITAYASDKLIEKGMLSVTRVRQLSDIYAKIFMATPLVIMGYLPQGAWVTVFLLYLVMACGFAGNNSGFMTNPGDLSPAHTGFLVGLGQGLTMWTSFLIPVLSASITSEETRDSWQLVFYLCLIIGLVTTLCFFLMGSGELQPWATETVNEKTPIMQVPMGSIDTRNDIAH